MLGGFVWHESRTAEPMLPLDFFRSGRYSGASAVYAVMYLSLAGVFFFVTLLFQDVRTKLRRRPRPVDDLGGHALPALS